MNWIDIGILLGSILALVAITQSVKFRAYYHVAGRLELPDDEFVTKFFPEPRRQIAIKVRQILAPYLPTGVTRIQPQDRLVKDLGLSARISRGMDLVNFVEDLKQEFSIEFSEEDFFRLKTFADAVNIVAEKRTGSFRA